MVFKLILPQQTQYPAATSIALRIFRQKILKFFQNVSEKVCQKTTHFSPIGHINFRILYLFFPHPHHRIIINATQNSHTIDLPRMIQYNNICFRHNQNQRPTDFFYIISSISKLIISSIYKKYKNTNARVQHKTTQPHSRHFTIPTHFLIVFLPYICISYMYFCIPCIFLWIHSITQDIRISHCRPVNIYFANTSLTILLNTIKHFNKNKHFI